MATSLASLVVELAANTARFERDMTKAAAHARTAGNNIQRALGGIDRTFATLTRSVTAFAGTLGVVTSVGGLTLLGKQALSFADELDEMSQRLGINVESLQAWQFAARQSGVQAQQLERGFRTLADTVGDAARDEAGAVKKFQDIGVSIEGAQGRVAPFEEIIARVADRIASATTQVEKINIANKAFGDRVGTFLLPILDRGRAGFTEWAKAAREAGVIVDTEMIKQAGKAKDMLDAMSTSIMANLVPAIVAVSPHLITLAQKITDVAKAVGRYFSSFVDPQLLGLDEVNRQIAELEREATKLRKALTEATHPDDMSAVGKFFGGANAYQGALKSLQENEARLAALRTQRDKLTGQKGADVPLQVFGTGAKTTKELDDLRRRLQDLGTEDDFAKQILDLQRMLAKAKEEAPRFAAEIDKLGAAMFEAAANAVILKREAESIKALEESFKDLGDTEGLEQVVMSTEDVASALGQTRVEMINDQIAIDNLRESFRELTEANESFESGLQPTSTGLKRAVDALEPFREGLQQIADEEAVFGAAFDDVAARADLLRSEIRRLTIELGPFSEEVQNLKTQLDELAKIDLATAGVKDVFGALDQALTQSIAGVIQGTQTIREAFDKMGQSIALSLIQNVIRRGINEVEKAVVELVAQLVKTGLWSFMQPGAAAQAGAAPTMVGAGQYSSFEPAFSYQSGGLARTPQVATLAEHEPEYVIPQSDMAAMMRGGDTTIVVNNYGNDQVTARESQTPDGRVIEIMIQSAVDKGISSGRFDKSMGGAYGVSRMPVRR